MIRKIINVLSVLLFIIQPLGVSAASTDSLSEADLTSEIAISIEASTGEVIFEKNAHEQAFPASITKVMTALLLLEYVEEDELITMTEASLHEVRSNSIVEFTAGEQMDRNTALYFIMLLSANDVATSIGEHIAGSREAFGELMTEKAKELGATNTNFTNPSGLHDDNHYTTAYDMALIVREALQYPELIEAMSLQEKTVSTSLQTLTIPNRSNMFEIENFHAGKTGFTSQAQHTLVEISENSGVYLVNVVMRSNNQVRYEDIEKMANYGFSQIEQRVVVDRSQWSTEHEFLGREVSARVVQSLQIPTLSSTELEVTTKFHPVEFSDEELFSRGIYIGDEIGQLDVIVDGSVVSTIPVVADETVLFNKSLLMMLEETVQGLIQVLTTITLLQILYVFFGMIGTILMIRTFNIKRRKLRKRKKEIYAAQQRIE